MASSSAAVVSDQLQVRALHPALGAEVRGVDMRTPLDPDTFSAVHDAWMQHLVLVFPGQQITDEEHVAFTRGFGEPEIFHQNIIRSRLVKEIFRVSNVDDEGNLMPPDHPTVKQVSLAQFWHTDSSYRTIPCTGALLHGVETSRTGGETQFTNMYAVYEALPDLLKRQVQGRKARHNFGHAASLAAVGAQTPGHRSSLALHQPDLQ
jgi:alpha-ketoglutarate-dependent taurine dioxygenase